MVKCNKCGIEFDVDNEGYSESLIITYRGKGSIKDTSYWCDHCIDEIGSPRSFISHRWK